MAVSGPGRPLDYALQAEYGRRFRRDFGGVRVHTDRSAAASATAIGATAYTLGQSIVFGPGRYSPGTTAGRRLIAHELAHVAQQDTRDSGTSGSARIDPSPPAEADAREAARAADVADGTGTSTLHPVGGGAIQRQTTDDENKPKTEAKPPPAPTTATPPATTASPASTATQATQPRRVIDTSALRDLYFGPSKAQPSPDSAEPGNAPSLTYPTLPQLTLPPFPGLPRRTPLTFEPGSEPAPEPGSGLTPPTIPGPPQFDPTSGAT